MSEDSRAAFRLIFLRYGSPSDFVKKQYIKHVKQRGYCANTRLLQIFAEDILFYELLPGSLNGLPAQYILDVNKICNDMVSAIYMRCELCNVNFKDLVDFINRNKK